MSTCWWTQWQDVWAIRTMVDIAALQLGTACAHLGEGLGGSTILLPQLLCLPVCHDLIIGCQAIESHSWLIAEKHFTSIHKSNLSWLHLIPRRLCESHSALDQYSSTSIMHSQTSFTSRSSFWPATFLGSTSLKRCKSSRAAWNKQHGAAVCYESKCCDFISTSLGVGSFGGKAEGPSKKQSWRWKN